MLKRKHYYVTTLLLPERTKKSANKQKYRNRNENKNKLAQVERSKEVLSLSMKNMRRDDIRKIINY